jgi:hypothetical protein
VLQVSTLWKSDGTSVSVLVEDVSRNKCFFPRFEYHMIYVLYPFVTCLLILPHVFLSIVFVGELLWTCNLLHSVLLISLISLCTIKSLL